MKHNIFDAHEYVRDIQESFQKIMEAISNLQHKKKRTVDKHRRPLELNINDWVLLKFIKAQLGHTIGKDWQGESTGYQKLYCKLAKRHYGPFQILERINETSYRLKFPPTWHIHNALHAGLLKSFKGTPPTKSIEEDPLEFEEQENILQLEIILRHEDIY